MLFLFLATALASPPAGFPPIVWKHRPQLEKLNPQRDLPEILDLLGSALVGKPYELGPLGEGPGSAHPQPLYRLDAFDCTTYIETVLANAYCFGSKQPSSCIGQKMQTVRYTGGKISFAARNHIPELDWLPGNERRGYLQNLSGKVFPGEWKEARITIDRKLWLAQQGEKNAAESLKGGTLSYLPVTIFFRKAELKPEEQKAADAKLAQANLESGALPEEEQAKVKFRAEMELLKTSYVPILEKLAQIPSGTVLNLIRRPAKSAAEGKLLTLVAHQGLVVQRADGAHILQAVPSGHVRDQLLGDYLLRYVRSAHFQGISLYQVLPAN